MPHHLEPVPSELPDDGFDPFEPDELDELEPTDFEPLVRPAWWRWVAIALIVALAVAGPFAFALYRLLT